jgi:hypothetical protein
MDQAALRHQMAEVVRAARETLRDPAQASRLWGCTADLCEVLERNADGASQRATLCIALREDIRTGARSTPDLAEEIVWFIRTVQHAIADEELDAIVDGVVRGDHVGG